MDSLLKIGIATEKPPQQHPSGYFDQTLVQMLYLQDSFTCLHFVKEQEL